MDAVELEGLLIEAALATRETTWQASPKIGLAMGHEDNGRHVQRWGEPQEGYPGPIARCARFLLAAAKLQADPKRRFHALHYLCELVGGRFIEPRGGQGTLPDLMTTLADSVGSYGQVCEEFSEGHRDNRWTPSERDEFIAACRTHRSYLHELEERVRRESKGVDPDLQAVS